MLSQSLIKTYWSPRCTGPWARVSLYGSGAVTVRAAVVSAVKALNTVLTAYKYATRSVDTGAYNCRLTASGSWSLHAYGLALDINWQSNPYTRVLRTDMTKNGDGRMPHRICAIRTNNGKQVWNWGGFWNGSKDAMHYEVVCSPADLRTGINWSTVYGGGAGTTPTPTPTPTPAPEPSSTQENIVYRLVTFSGEPTAPGDQPDTAAIYRCFCARAEFSRSGADQNQKYIPVEGWWVRSAEELKVWQARGLFVVPGAIAPRWSIRLHDGPFDNTATD